MDALRGTEMLWHERIQHQAKLEMILRQLRRKFGMLPDSFVTELQAVTDPDALDEIAEQLLTAESLEDIVLPTVI